MVNRQCGIQDQAQEAGGSAGNKGLCSPARYWWVWWASSPAHNCPHCVNCRRPISVLGRSKAPSSSVGRRSTDLASQPLRSPSLLSRSHQPHRASKNTVSHARTRCDHLWFPGKGIKNMSPRVSGMFYSTKLQASLTWWKLPQN